MKTDKKIFAIAILLNLITLVLLFTWVKYSSGRMDKIEENLFYVQSQANETDNEIDLQNYKQESINSYLLKQESNFYISIENIFNDLNKKTPAKINHTENIYIYFPVIVGFPEE
jgi:preprotein translocase subunit SecF